MISIDQLTLSVGSQELLTNVSAVFFAKDKVGIVGRNGIGKTSLFLAILGELLPDQGKIRISQGTRIGWLPQSAVSGSSKKLWDEARSRMVSHEERERRLTEAQAAVERGEEGAIERYDAAAEAFRISGGWKTDERIGMVLHGLGFQKEDWERPCDEFSGGWQMRIALARLLLSEPTVLMLDEPTNHLDLEARMWLCDFLLSYPHTVMVISHDRFLLDRVCRRIVEIRDQNLIVFTGNYSAWRKERTARLEQARIAYATQQDEVQRLEGFIDRFRAKATKAAQAQSRQKQLDRMDRLEAPEVESPPRLVLSSSGIADPVMEIRGSVGRERPLVTGMEWLIGRGERWGLIGPNGCGKTTLLQAITARLPMLTGVRKLGKDVKIGYFAQDQAQELPNHATPLDIVLMRAPRALPAQARAALGAMGLRGDSALRKIGDLSGGEKARVVLASFAVQDHDLLLLDEPTNHLDLMAVEVLANALTNFAGACVFISHDRWFVEAVATHIGRIHLGKLELSQGVSSDVFEPVSMQRSMEGSSAGSSTHQEKKKRTREIERLGRRIEGLSQEITATEQQLTVLDEQMVQVATDHTQLRLLVAKRTEIEHRIDAMYLEWGTVEERIKQLQEGN